MKNFQQPVSLLDFDLVASLCQEACVPFSKILTPFLAPFIVLSDFQKKYISSLNLKSHAISYTVLFALYLFQCMAPGKVK